MMLCFIIVVEQLKEDKKIAQATHNIMAWKLKEGGIQGRDDDGEGGAGDRLLFMLDRQEFEDIVVVVTRWYGGIHLGGARFKIISNCARELIVERASELFDDNNDDE